MYHWILFIALNIDENRGGTAMFQYLKNENACEEIKKTMLSVRDDIKFAYCVEDTSFENNWRGI